MTKLRPALSLIAAVAALAACGGNGSTDPFAAATPDVAGLTLETSGTGEGVTASATSAATADPGLATAAASAACEPYQYLCNIHAAVAGLNGYVRAVIAPVEALAKTTPTVASADVRVFGPVDVPTPGPVATFRLTVQQVAEGAFRWKLDGKPLGAGDDAYVVVAAGAMRRGPGDLPHRGRGTLGIDLDHLYALNPAGAAPIWNGEGKLLVGFGHVGGAKSLAYALRDFTPDRTQTPPIPAAAIVGHRTAAGVTRVRLATVNEFVGPAAAGTDAGNELLLSRAGWIPGVGGRAVVAVAGGDVPSYGIDFLLGVSCYDAVEHEVFRALFGCTAGVCVRVPNAPAGFDVGSPSACIPGTDLGVDEQNPPEDPQAGVQSETPEPGAPAVPDPVPSSMADVSF
ncbi:hypothetical protein [Anaeromyxobacter oryzae]|uniref:Lipoprotein n=1 Tax=Anaeromyxobacter oryzae TaxID=2918170 RepID=A0ABM7WUC7_9BACT|nr:hypothetical protein [Anaeromyxobacter oryzae]BDG03093.1 hypothetical protein AMOR_20890 [Anaeromyxobacter oryzae]